MFRLFLSISLLFGAQAVVAAVNEDIILNVGEPKPGMTYQGIANLRGWALSKNSNVPLDKVEAWMSDSEDDKLQVPLGGYRSDVANNPDFGQYPNALNSGFSMAFNYGNYEAGNHTLIVRAYDINGNWAEERIDFTIASFPNPFIEAPVTLNPSTTETIAQSDESFRITGVEIDGGTYDLTLRWRTESQGFAIESINSQGQLEARWDNEREAVVIEDTTAAAISLADDFACGLGRIEVYPSDAHDLEPNAVLFRTPYHRNSGEVACSGTVNRTLLDGEGIISEPFSFELGKLGALAMFDTFARIEYTYNVTWFQPETLQNCVGLTARFINENANNGAQAGTQISAYSRANEVWGLEGATDCARYWEGYQEGMPVDDNEFEFDKGGKELLIVGTQIQTENAYKSFVFYPTEKESLRYISVQFRSPTNMSAVRQYRSDQEGHLITYQITGDVTDKDWSEVDLSKYNFLFTVYNHTDSCDNSPQTLLAAIDEQEPFSIEPGSKAKVQLQGRTRQQGGAYRIRYQFTNGSWTDFEEFDVDDDTNWTGWGCNWDDFTPY